MNRKPLNKQITWNAWYFIIAIVGILLLQEFFAQGQRVDVIPYSAFEEQVKAGKVATVTISNNHIQGSYKEPQKDGKTEFVTTRVEVPPELAASLQQNHVQVSGAVENHLLATLLSWIVPVLLFFGVWYFVFRRFASRGGIGGGLMSIGKSKAKIYVEQNTKVTFNDVAGIDEAKDELREIVGFLKDPDHYRRLGGRVPKGVLLVGPPGTGKTLLARAVAGEAGVPFFSISGAEFVEMFVGVGAARVRDLFEQARQKAPAIIFIDELDALGRARGSFPMGGGNDEKEQTLNQLLAELDGFDPTTGLVLLAATNRPEILDPALLRAGRFDRQVLVDRPDRSGRVAILKVHLKSVKLAADADPEKIAGLTPGFTGADLANLVNEAALLATRRNAQAIGMEDFTNAIERIVAGLEKRNRILNPQEREVIAYHEMGHALVALSLPGVDTVHKVSIIPRGIGSLGYTIQRPTEDRFLMTREELENKMAVLLGGRAAESVVFGRFSTGAADDLQKVTDIARNMVTRYGMSDELGHVTYERDNRTFLAGPSHMEVHERQYSEATAREIDNVVKRIVDGAFERTTTLLRSQREILDRCARVLLEKETLNEKELLKLTGRSHLAAAQ